MWWSKHLNLARTCDGNVQQATFEWAAAGGGAVSERDCPAGAAHMVPVANMRSHNFSCACYMY